MKTLGIIFMIIAVLCGVGGIINTQISISERLSRDIVNQQNSARESGVAGDALLRALGSNRSTYDSKEADWQISRSNSQYQSIKSRRETRMMWFFASGAILTIIGLILAVAAPKQTTPNS